MKKVLALALCLSMILGLGACGTQGGTDTPNNSSSNTSTPVTPAPVPGAGGDVQRFSWGTVNSTGANYIIGGSIANVVNTYSEVPVIVTAETSTGSSVNLRGISEGEVQMGCANADLAYDYYAARGDYTDFGSDTLRSMFSFYASKAHIVVPASSDIYTSSDLIGKRVAFGAPGSGYSSVSTKFLDSQGLTYADFDAQETNPPQAIEAMRNGQLDGFIFCLQVPTATITDLTTSMDIRLISLTDQELENFFNAYPGYYEDTIPGGSYANNPDDIQSFAVRTIVVTDSEVMDEETGYAICKAMWENRDIWASVHAATSEMIFEEMPDYLSVPMQAGFYKYYVEQGIKIPENLIPPEAK